MSSYLKTQKAFGHKLIGNKSVKKIVSETLLVFPNKIIEFVTKKCWIVSSFEDGWAFTLKANDLKKGQYLIFLSDELLSEEVDQIRYTIAHEIGHIILDHRNSIGAHQSKGEIRAQEKEADIFAKRYLYKEQ